MITEATVKLIAATAFFAGNTSVPDWSPDANDQASDALAEFAGRACYQSWSRPNPETATNQGYLNNIISVGHFSVLEHASATFYLTGISRSLTHELVRHRHLSFSQLSQRYVDGSESEFITPPEIADDPGLVGSLTKVSEDIVTLYEALVDHLSQKLKAEGVKGTEARKRARQAARAVMPNMTETRIVVTGNMRAWRHFLDMRAAQAADTEIRAVAMKIYRKLLAFAPNTFQDYQLVNLADGTEALMRNGDAG